MITAIGSFQFKRDNTFVIAELSANHRNDFDVAVKTIEAAKQAGADAIKLQTFTADTITLKSDSPLFVLKQGTIWDGRTYYDLYSEASMPWEWQPKLKKIAEDLGMVCFSSPFDPSSVDFLEKMNVPAYKVASFEITDIPLIRYIAQKRKPVLISTGIATSEDIELAVKTCRDAGNEQIALLKCTSSYPAPVEKANLATIPAMAQKFNCMAGLSDHSVSDTVVVTAVALGARIVEKHFILDKSLGGPDAEFSLSPEEFRRMCASVRDCELAKGTETYAESDEIKGSREFSRSLFVVQNIQKGELFCNENIRSIRPAYGLHPKYLDQIIGKKAKSDISAGSPLSLEMIE